jgi:hypothetical protein
MRAVLPQPIDELIFPPDVQALTFWIVLTAFVSAFVLVAARPPLQRAWLVPLFVFISTPPHLLLVWHGDSGEVTRHGVVASVALRLALVMAVLCIVDAWLTRSWPKAQGDSARAAP